MKLRQLPGALALGLVASLVAHALVYGDGHVQGGAYHDAFQGAAIGTGSAFVGFLIYLAFFRFGRCVQGSVVAARMRPLLPSPLVLTAAATIWFAVGESLEPAHAQAPLLLTAGTLALTALLTFSAALAAIEAIAAVAVAVLRQAFAQRRPLWARRPRSLTFVRRAAIVRRRFARPPPGAMLTS
jgi:hypothetical protein